MNRRITIEEFAAASTQRKSKYGVDLTEQGKSDRTYNGVRYDSKRECEYAKELDVLLRAGAIQWWERQVVFPLEVNGVSLGSYRADFVVGETSLTRKVIDVKGHMTPVARLKLKLMKAIYGFEVEVVK